MINLLHQLKPTFTKEEKDQALATVDLMESTLAK